MSYPFFRALVPIITRETGLEFRRARKDLVRVSKDGVLLHIVYHGYSNGDRRLSAWANDVFASDVRGYPVVIKNDIQIARAVHTRKDTAQAVREIEPMIVEWLRDIPPQAQTFENYQVYMTKCIWLDEVGKQLRRRAMLHLLQRDIPAASGILPLLSIERSWELAEYERLSYLLELLRRSEEEFEAEMVRIVTQNLETLQLKADPLALIRAHLR